MPYKLFIFDFDGTLANSGPMVAEVFNSVAARFNFRQLSRDEIEQLRGLDNRAILRELRIPFWRLPAIAAYTRKLAQDAPPPPLFDGAESMLRELRNAGATLAIVSSNSETTIRRALGEAASLIQIYDCAASIFGKAGRFKRVVKRSGLPRAAAISIGDETRDIEAARKARIACGAVTWGYATPELLRAHNADVYFDKPEDIAALLRA